MFDISTTQLILNTQLQTLEDKLIWKGETNGNYLACSIYRMCVSKIVDDSHIYILGHWKLVCKLKVPPKRTKTKNSLGMCILGVFQLELSWVVERCIVQHIVSYVVVIMRIVFMCFWNVLMLCRFGVM